MPGGVYPLLSTGSTQKDPSRHMRRSRNFRHFVRGGPGQSDKKALTFFFFFFFFFLVISSFYRTQMVSFKEIYHFSRFQRGSNIFQGGGGGGGGGPTFSRGGPIAYSL